MSATRASAATKIEQRIRLVQGKLQADLGGFEGCSESQLQLIRRAAALTVACEQFECAAAAGLEAPLDAYLRTTEVLRRVIALLGTERRSGTNIANLSDYLRDRYGE